MVISGIEQVNKVRVGENYWICCASISKGGRFLKCINPIRSKVVGVGGSYLVFDVDGKRESLYPATVMASGRKDIVCTTKEECVYLWNTVILENMSSLEKRFEKVIENMNKKIIVL